MTTTKGVLRAAPRVLVSLLVTGCLLPMSIATDAGTNPYYLTSKYQLLENEEPVADSKLYLAKGQPRLVIVSRSLKAPYLLSGAERRVGALAEEALVPIPSDPDALSVDETAMSREAAKVTISGRALIFGLEGRRFRVEPPEPIVARLSGDEAMARIPEFRRRVAAYTPSQGNVRLLKTWSEPVELLVFMGSWCPHCERLVPRLEKTLGVVGGENIVANYQFLPRKMNEDPIARQYGIKAVPTVVVLQDGVETTRFEGADLNHPEATLARILFGS